MPASPMNLGGAGRGVSGVAVHVEGLTELIAKIRAIGAYAPRQLGFVLYAAAKAGETEMHRTVPVASGKLRDGTRAEKQGVFDWELVSSSRDGGAEREYAGYVNFGTWKMPARPYFTAGEEAAFAAMSAGLIRLSEEILLL